MKVEINTSVDDLKSSFKCSNGIKFYSKKDLENALFEEINGQNRISIKKLLRRALRMKDKGAHCI